MTRRDVLKRLGLLAPLALCPMMSAWTTDHKKGTKPPVDAPKEKTYPWPNDDWVHWYNQDQYGVFTEGWHHKHECWIRMFKDNKWGSWEMV